MKKNELKTKNDYFIIIRLQHTKIQGQLTQRLTSAIISSIKYEVEVALFISTLSDAQEQMMTNGKEIMPKE